MLSGSVRKEELCELLYGDDLGIHAKIEGITSGTVVEWYWYSYSMN